MDVFLLECLYATGWKRGGDTYWTFDSAKAEAERLVRRKLARRVRILPISVNLNATEEVPAINSDRTPGVSHA